MNFWRDTAIIFTCGVAVTALLNFNKAASLIAEQKMCIIALNPEEYVKENKKLISYQASELAKKRCGK